MLAWAEVNQSVQRPAQPRSKVRPTKPLGSIGHHPADSRVVFLIRAWPVDGLVGVVCDLECSFTLFGG